MQTKFGKLFDATELNELRKKFKYVEAQAKIGRASVGKECVRRCRSRWSPYH